MRVSYAFLTRLQLLQINRKVKFLLNYKVTVMVTFFCVMVSMLQAQETQYEFTASKYLLGTKIDITARSGSVDSMKKAMYYSFREIERIQGILSMQSDSSEISLINNYAGIQSVKVSYETYSLIERSIEYSRLYPCFDITIGPISELWGFNSDVQVTSVPGKKIIDSLLNLVGFEKIKMNAADTSVFLPFKGMLLDPGGIAKGYAVDRAALEMKKNGVTNFIINAGGDIYISGKKSRGEKWRIGIKHPRKEGEVIAVMELPEDGAVGTSGDYERFAVIEGKRYHHIFDVKTGYPVMITQSATSFASSVEEAVVLSKYFFISIGENYSSGLLKLPAVIVSSNGEVFYDNKLTVTHSLKLVK